MIITCRCGREIGPVPHCPICGSSNLYGRSTGSVQTMVEGLPVTSRGFRCRKCGTCFHELEQCQAPPPKPVGITAASRASATRVRTSDNFDASKILEAAKAAIKAKALPTGEFTFEPNVKEDQDVQNTTDSKGSSS